MRHLETALLTTAALGAAPAAAQDVGADPALMRTGRTYTQWFREEGRLSLGALHPRDARRHPRSRELAAFRAEVEGDLGSYTANGSPSSAEPVRWQTIRPRE
jgi:hypothetical protein